MHTINIVFSSFAIVSMYPDILGKNGYILCKSFGQKRETLPGSIVLRVEPK